MSLAAIDLHCIPYAGASGHIFNQWERDICDGIRLISYTPQGRGGRYSEGLPQSLVDIVSDFCNCVTSSGMHNQRVFFGHSMGAIIAYEAALSLKNTPYSPSLLIVSGRRSPCSKSTSPPIGHHDDMQFLLELLKYEGIPEACALLPEFKEFFLPIIKNDFLISEAYTAISKASLDIPVLALTGETDAFAPFKLSDKWRLVTHGIFEHDMFPGGHFFLETDAKRVLKQLEKRIYQLVDR